MQLITGEKSLQVATTRAPAKQVTLILSVIANGDAPEPSLISNDPDEARAGLLLPRISQEKVEAGIRIAKSLKIKSILTWPKLIAECKTKTEHQDYISDPEVMAVIITETYKSSAIGMATAFSGLEKTSPYYDKTYSATIRYFFQQTAERSKELLTAAFLERYAFRSRFKATENIIALAGSEGCLGLVRIAYPGVTKGNDPIVRPWKLIEQNTFPIDRLAKMAPRVFAHFLKHELKLLDQQMQPIKEKFFRINWYHEQVRAGIAPMAKRLFGNNNMIPAMQLAAKQLGIPNMFGTAENQVPYWKVSHDGMWQELFEGEALIYHVTREVVRLAKERHPDFLIAEGDQAGEFKPECIRKVIWGGLFAEVADGSIRYSGLTAQQALAGVTNFFGFESNQIQEIDIQGVNQINPTAVRNLVAHCLYKEGLGNIFKVDRQTYKYSLSLSQFKDWSAQRKQAQGFLEGFVKKYALESKWKGIGKTSAAGLVYALFEDHVALPEGFRVRNKATAFFEIMEAYLTSAKQQTFTLELQDSLAGYKPLILDEAQTQFEFYQICSGDRITRPEFEQAVRKKYNLKTSLAIKFDEASMASFSFKPQ